MLKQLLRKEQTTLVGVTCVWVTVPAQETVKRGQLSSSSLHLPDILLIKSDAVGITSFLSRFGTRCLSPLSPLVSPQPLLGSGRSVLWDIEHPEH